MKKEIGNTLHDLWINNTAEGFAVFNPVDLSIQYINDRCRELCSLKVSNRALRLSDILDEEDARQLLTRNAVELNINARLLCLEVIKSRKKSILIVHDETALSEGKKKNRKLKRLSRKLSDIYESYIEDYILVTNPIGKIEYISKKSVEIYGVEIKSVLGKNVKELGIIDLFEPSVIIRANETKSPQVAIQTTREGHDFVCFSAPVLDNEDNITKIVTISRTVSKWLEKGKLFYSDYINTIDTDGETVFEKQILTCSVNMVNTITLAKMASSTESTILIIGETGTGKEVLAKYIHQRSSRADKPFIKINCGAIANEIAESELFGYEAGSFTGAKKDGKKGLMEAANGGTLFLDEIGDLPMNQQVKLLRALQEKEICRVGSTKPTSLDIRVISATNIDLKRKVEKGEFREDLFYRLNVISINIPPLRERNADISILALHFLDVFSKAYSKKRITNAAIKKLSSYHWPGNVRELENTIERLAVSTNSTLIEVSDIPRHILENSKREDFAGESEDAVTINGIMPMAEALKIAEQKLIQMAFEKYGSGKKVAEALEVDPATISRKISGDKS